MKLLIFEQKCRDYGNEAKDEVAWSSKLRNKQDLIIVNLVIREVIIMNSIKLLIFVPKCRDYGNEARDEGL